MKSKDFIFKTIFLIILYSISIIVIFAGFFYIPQEVQKWEYFRLILFVLFVPLLFKYSIHLLVVPWYGIITNKLKTSSHYQPRVSVLIPAWNEEVGIIRTVESILKSSYKKYELIIINDGSSDKTGEKIVEYINRYRGNVLIKYIEKENGGKASALNLGIAESSGEIILTTDADCSIDQFAIENLVKYFSENDIMAVAGNVRVGNNKKNIGAIQKLEYVYGFYFKRADSILNSVYIVGGAAAAYRKEIFSKLGNFDVGIITEDIEYSTRILNAGYKIRYATDSIFYTEVPSDVNSLIKQRLRWKYGRLKTFYKHKELFFKCKGNHSKFLSLVVLPVAFFSELLLFLEVIFLPLFYIYTFLSGDFFPLALVALILTLIVLLQIITDVKKAENRDVATWAPVAWIIFYFLDFVEYVALIKSLVQILKKRKVVWQKWDRIGVFVD